MISRILALVSGITISAMCGIAWSDEPPDGKSIAGCRGPGRGRAWLAGGGVTVLLRATEPLLKDGTAHTNADGRYRIEWSQSEQADSEVQLMVLAPGFAYRLVPASAPPGKAAAEIKLKAEAWKTTEIRLADPSGRPAVGVELLCSIALASWARLKTDAAGLCRFAMAIGVPTHFEAKPPGARPINLTLLNGKDDPATIKLPVLEPIRGRVHDAAGRPLSGVSIGRLFAVKQGKTTVLPHSRGPASKTDNDGRFELAPPVAIDSHDLNHPGRYRFPSSICFADRDLKRLAFGIVDLVEPRSSRWTSPSSRAPGSIFRSSQNPRVDARCGREVPIVSLCPGRLPRLSRCRLLYHDLSTEELEDGNGSRSGCREATTSLTVHCRRKEGGRLGASGTGTGGARRSRARSICRHCGSSRRRINRWRVSRLPRSRRTTATPVSPSVWPTSAARWWFSISGATGVVPATRRCRTWPICTDGFEGRPVVVVALHDQSVQSRTDYDRRTAFARSISGTATTCPSVFFLIARFRASPPTATLRGPGPRAKIIDSRGFSDSLRDRPAGNVGCHCLVQ